MSTTRRRLLSVLAMVVVGSCGMPPPGPTIVARPTGAAGPTGTFEQTPSGTVPAAATRSPSAATIDPAAAVPRIVFKSHSPSGPAWSVTEPGDPEGRLPLQVPAADAELGPTSPDGQILLTTGDRILVVSLEGSTLTPSVSWPVPPGPALAPACFTAGGRPILADVETLRLVELTEAGIQPFSDVAFTLGECAPLGDGRTLVAVEGGGLVAVRDGRRSSSVVGLLGRHLSGGGGLVAMTDPSSELGAVTVRRATVSGDGELGEEIGRVAARARERVVDAQLSPDGDWLAVTLERETEAELEGRLRLYSVTDGGLTEVSDLGVEVGTRIALLPSP